MTRGSSKIFVTQSPESQKICSFATTFGKRLPLREESQSVWPQTQPKDREISTSQIFVPMLSVAEHKNWCVFLVPSSQVLIAFFAISPIGTTPTWKEGQTPWRHLRNLCCEWHSNLSTYFRECFPHVCFDFDCCCFQICLEGYKNPKSLNCLHTFCENCIENHVMSESTYKKWVLFHTVCSIARWSRIAFHWQSDFVTKTLLAAHGHPRTIVSPDRYSDYREFTCPLCRKRTQLPIGGVKKLPDNFLVSSLSEVRTND